MADLSNVRVAVLATDGVEAVELTEPVKALREARALVDILAPHEGEIQGFSHFDKSQRLPVSRALKRGMEAEYDALVLPGGALNADFLRMVPEARAFVSAFDAAKKPIAVICHGAWTLISAGLVKGRRLAAYHTIQDDIRNAGGQWLDQEVVRDGNWVSSRQPSDLPAFNREMIALFSRAKVPAGAPR